MNPGPVAVVSLGAWCDLDSSPAASSFTGTPFRVREFALLSDGREVTLLDDRGWATSEPLGGTADDPEARMSLAHVVGNLSMAVLPDDAEQTGEEHEWQHFVERLGDAGVAVTPDELRALPYHITLSDRLRSRLGEPS